MAYVQLHLGLQLLCTFDCVCVCVCGGGGGGGGSALTSHTIINQKRRVAFKSQWAPCLKTGLALDMSTDWTTERVFGLELTYAMHEVQLKCACVCVPASTVL